MVHAISQAVIADFPPLQPEFNPRSNHVGFVDKTTLGQVFCEHFGFLCLFSFR
jgi:hypothetical protein